MGKGKENGERPKIRRVHQLLLYNGRRREEKKKKFGGGKDQMRSRHGEYLQKAIG